VDFALLLEKHVSALNGRIDDLHAEVASNHGHITTCLFPVLEECIARLKTTLATKTEALESKGVSLLTKCNTLKDRVLTIIDGRLNVSEPTTLSPPAWSGPLEPPDDPQNDIGHAVDLAGSVHNPTDDSSVNIVETAATAATMPATTATSLTDTPINVNAHTRLAYATAHAMNSQYHAHAAPSRAPPATHRDVSPARNPYLPRNSLRQTTLPESFFCEHRPGAPEPIHATPGGPGAASGTDNIRPVVGGSIISPRHQNQDLRARALGTSRFDVIRLACSDYHMGMDGITTLTDDHLKARGFAQVTATVEDVMICYNDIILAHRKIVELWYNAYLHTSGPQVDKIIQKSLLVFPRLELMNVEDVVDFYDRLQ
jgi:hypothetical protein